MGDRDDMEIMDQDDGTLNGDQLDDYTMENDYWNHDPNQLASAPPLSEAKGDFAAEGTRLRQGGGVRVVFRRGDDGGGMKFEYGFDDDGIASGYADEGRGAGPAHRHYVAESGSDIDWAVLHIDPSEVVAGIAD